MKKSVRALKLSAAAAVVIALSGGTLALAGTKPAHLDTQTGQVVVHTPDTLTPIKHVVVIFQENVSFDHYFGTYPVAANPSGEPKFFAAPGTPSVNGLTGPLLINNPNKTNPKRLDRNQSITDDMDHDYTAEQKAYDGGLADKFVENTAGTDWPFANQDPNAVMDYYDGNTVTAMWNYAQHFAMNDNSYNTTFGPSTVGALNVISGQTHGATGYSASQSANGTQLQPDSNGVIIKGKLNSNGTLFSDADPYYDTASKGSTVAMSGKNVGDLLNGKDITWGWFEGGFRDPSVKHAATGDGSQTAPSTSDYSAHHEPFQYYASTANPKHLPPTSTALIGHQGDQANHQYDITDFWSAVNAHNMPAVSYLKAPAYQDGHAGYSGPLDEQRFLVNTINTLEQTPEWSSTAVVISYDDSDGWYDHAMPPVINQSNDTNTDALNMGTPKLGTYLDRAGYGPRLPLIVISPYAKHNFVDGTLTDQTSILRFIEDNFRLDQIGDNSFDAVAGSMMNMFDFTHGPSNNKLFLDANTGEPVSPVGSAYTEKGKQYMSLWQFAEVLNANLQQTPHQAWFTFNGHLVTVPFGGHTVMVDMQPLELGGQISSKNNNVYLPIDNLAAKLGVNPAGLTQGYAEPLN